jgi:hypothetical protein
MLYAFIVEVTQQRSPLHPLYCRVHALLSLNTDKIKMNAGKRKPRRKIKWSWRSRLMKSNRKQMKLKPHNVVREKQRS